MRNLTRTVLAFVLLLSVTPTCFGQQSRNPKRRAKPRPRPAPEKEEEFPFPTIIIGAPELRGRAEPDEVREVGLATIRYSRQRDETMVYIAGEVYREAPVLIMLSLTFEVKGRQVVRPEVVNVTAFGNVASFDEDGAFIIVADGKRFDFKPEPLMCDKRKCVNLDATVDFAAFEQIAKSRKVTVHAAQYTFDLNAAAREGLGDMLRAIEGPPKNP